jgi:protein-disulfide isomerase
VARQNQATFWTVHDYLFEHQSDLTSDRLAETISAQAAENKSSAASAIDLVRLKQCMDSQESLPIVEQDLQLGSAIGISSTPTLLINGRAFVGVPTTDEILKIVANPPKADIPLLSKTQQPRK